MSATVRLGVSLDFGAAPGDDPVAAARHAEELGFDLVVLSDHLNGERSTVEPLSALAFVLAATDAVVAVPVVLALPYRHPAVLAKMAAEIDRRAPGRLIVGLGGGGGDTELRAFGMDVWRAGEKVRRQREAIELMRGLWTTPRCCYKGRHYRLEDATLSPRPAAPLPIWTGAWGPRALAMTGELADGWATSLYRFPLAEACRMRERVVSAALAAGRDPAALAYVYNLNVLVDERARPDARLIAGDPERVAEQVACVLAAGFDHLVFRFVGPHREQRERLAREVLPRLGLA